MCIVSIFSDETGNFILTHNRDESVLRPSSEGIEKHERYGRAYTGPVDLNSGGTWIYYSENYVSCILNGGYIKHAHRPPYRMSRGLVILELLKYASMDEFINEIELDGIEPFTMMMINRHSNEKKILIWDEKRKYREDVSGERLIVRSSSPLYTEEEKTEHKAAFGNLEEINSEKIFELHDELKMLQNDKFPSVQTTSITQIVQMENKLDLKFCPI